jgi:DNA polymerase III alpha subunit
MNQDLIRIDSQGQTFVSDQGVIELAYQDALHTAFEWQNAHSRQQFEQVCDFLDFTPFRTSSMDVHDRSWFTPSEYANIDLDSYILSRCHNPAQQARACEELKLVHELKVEPLFRHLIYLVDQWRSQDAVWGVGRGSSVSCFLLYVIGINKINPLDYELDYREFFKR